MKEKILQLIADGKTEEALTLLAQSNNDAILLQARYNNGKKQYNMGLIDFSEWQRIQSQVNYAALELAGSSKTAPVTGQQAPAQAPEANRQGTGSAAGTGASVFISYNHQDKAYAERIQQFLSERGVIVAIDFQDMTVGQNIQDFILQQIRANKAVLSLVSKNSLRSGWVGIESDLTMYNQLLTDQGFVPVMIDSGVFDGNFFFEIIDEVDLKIKELDGQIDKARARNIGYSQFEAKRKRLHEQRNNLDKIFEHFQSVLIADISGENFDSGMAKVLRALQS